MRVQAKSHDVGIKMATATGWGWGDLSAIVKTAESATTIRVMMVGAAGAAAPHNQQLLEFFFSSSSCSSVHCGIKLSGDNADARVLCSRMTVSAALLESTQHS